MFKPSKNNQQERARPPAEEAGLIYYYDFSNEPEGAPAVEAAKKGAVGEQQAVMPADPHAQLEADIARWRAAGGGLFVVPKEVKDDILGTTP